LDTTIGLAGFWLIGSSIHIMTIAIQPGWQGLGLGEWLLLNLIGQGQSLGGRSATLEVRPSNHRAISLYQKYGFGEVGRRIAYYGDNGEDALILSTPSIEVPEYQAVLAQQQSHVIKRLNQKQVY
jgi:ribosomal-protein-alanine N-acetyltransferase